MTEAIETNTRATVARVFKVLSLCACTVVQLSAAGCDSAGKESAAIPSAADSSVAATPVPPTGTTTPNTVTSSTTIDTPAPRTQEGLEIQPQMLALQQYARSQPDLGYAPGTTPWRPAKPAAADTIQRPTAGALLAAVSAARGWSDMVGDAVWEQTTRIYADDDVRAVGVVLQWGFEDDAVAGHDYRVHIALRNGTWHVDRIEERDHCSRRVSADGLCA